MIKDNLATHGIDFESGKPLNDDWEVVDVRMLQEMDEDNPLDLYKSLILGVSEYLLHNKKVCIQCSGGVSRSNAIAVGVLIDHFKMDYYDALALVEDKVPICQIEDNHIRALKKMFNIGLP